VHQVVLWWVCVCVCVCRHCVVLSRGNFMAAVLRTIHFFIKLYRDFVIDDDNYYINNSD